MPDYRALSLRFNQRLAAAGDYLSGLVLRLFLAYEFADSGVTKLMGSNWFTEIQADFPFPLNIVPVEVSWFLATWSEILGALLLVVGLGTRYVSIVLMGLTLVAWYSVHAGYGYNICSNGYKMVVIYLVAFLPLLTSGAGKWSLDHWLQQRR